MKTIMRNMIKMVMNVFINELLYKEFTCFNQKKYRYLI